MAPARITEPFVSVLSRPRTTLRLGICLAMVSLALTGAVPTTAAPNPAAAPATGKIDGTVRLVASPGEPIRSGA